MSIEKGEQSWRGTEPADLDAYLEALLEDAEGPVRIVHPSCAQCGGAVFVVEFDPDEGCARRTCAACGTAAFVADSGSYWDLAHPVDLAYPSCGSREVDLAVAFTLRDEGDEVHWITAGVRCVRCGTLGSPVDWEVDYSPSAHLLQEA